MHFDPTIHLGDLIPLVILAGAAYQRVSRVLRSIDLFMEESRADRALLHKKVHALENRTRHDRQPSAATKLAEERLGK